MPPRKQVQDAPVVFSLRLPVEETAPTPQEQGSTSYSDILSAVETSRVGERFNTDTMKEILTRVKSPTYNSAACFWCCAGFSWKACVLPVSYDAYENMYTCEGHYCSPECALAFLYADTHHSDTVRWTRHCLLADMYRSLYTKKELTPAPPRSTLRLFGGPLDIEQFREYLANSDDLVAVALPPIRLHVPTMNVQGPVRDVKRYVTLSQDTVEKASKELRLRRTKPVHQAGTTLDKCITQTFG
jgi:hypothetical protein